jgi:hypothetical protein
VGLVGGDQFMGVEPVAAAITVEASRIHCRLMVMGCGIHTPSLQVKTWPSVAVPVMKGRASA